MVAGATEIVGLGEEPLISCTSRRVQSTDNGQAPGTVGSVKESKIIAKRLEKEDKERQGSPSWLAITCKSLQNKSTMTRTLYTLVRRLH